MTPGRIHSACASGQASTPAELQKERSQAEAGGGVGEALDLGAGGGVGGLVGAGEVGHQPDLGATAAQSRRRA